MTQIVVLLMRLFKMSARVVRTKRELKDKLEKFIADTKLSKTATVEKALKEYIDKYNKTGEI